jgi:tetratricopeptide (TPR) repeat protein
MAKWTIHKINRILKAKRSLVSPSTSDIPELQSALALHQQGQLVEAEAIYRQLLAIQPRNADALHLLGVIAHQNGNHKGADDLIGQAIAVNPTIEIYYFNRGKALKELKQFTSSVDNYDKAITLKPDFAAAYNNRGLSLQELKKLDAAITSYDKAISLKADFAEAFYNKGNALQELKQLDAAVASYDKAIELKPEYAEAYSNRGIALKDLRQLEAAVASYDKAIALKPNFATAFSNRGNALKELKQFIASVANYDKAIALKPDFAAAYNNRGLSLQELRQLDSAITSYDKAISLKPDYAEAFYNRGNALQELKQLVAAVASYDKAIALQPEYAEAYSNRGIALKDLNQLDAAITSYDKAIALKSDFPDARCNKSLLLLLNGELCEGFSLYEWRWAQKEDYLYSKRIFHQPLWRGLDPLLNKKILIHAEQGLGDTIQFCRYVRMVADLGAKVIFEVQKPLLPLLNDLSDVCTLIAKGDSLPEFDFHCPLMSLPLAFNTDLKSIPCAFSYLQADVRRVAYWKTRLKSNAFKIGICWQGSPGKRIDIGRSFELQLFQDIASLPDVQLISLQKGYGTEQLKSMPQGMEVLDIEDDLDESGAFLDSAAVMKNVDLFITSDTALAHLAGALGVKTWVVLKYVPDWRWMLERPDSPWYPSMTLYRQLSFDDWKPVFNQMQKDIISMRKTP